jgi:hypothetical protein
MSNTILNNDRELKIEELEVASGGNVVIETRLKTGTLVIVCSRCGINAVWVPK